jgi:hypothetical protein
MIREVSDLSFPKNIESEAIPLARYSG